jgi:integrase
MGHVKRPLGDSLVLEVTPGTVKQYQIDRLNETAAPKSVTEEVGMLLRLCGEQGVMIRERLRREKCLKLKIPPSPGKAFSVEEQERMLAVALASTQTPRLACGRQARREKPAKGDLQGGSPSIYPALVLALNCGIRDAEIRNLTWAQINVDKQILTVGRSKETRPSWRSLATYRGRRFPAT